MKTIKFTRDLNSINEYTASSFDDATGEYLRKEDVLALIQDLHDCEVREVAKEVLEDIRDELS